MIWLIVFSFFYLISSENVYSQTCPKPYVVLKNVSCLHENAMFHTSGSVSKQSFEVERFWTNFPHFWLPKNSKNDECRNHSHLVLSGIQKMDVWSLKMVDSTAKLPSGILNGNVNQFGDFDQCISISEKIIDPTFGDQTVNGKYCLMDVSPDLRRFGYVNDLVHSHFAIRGTFQDPKHRVPSFSSIKWAFCVPASCSVEDVEEMVKEHFNVSLNIEPSMCQTKHRAANSPIGINGEIFTGCFFGLLLLAVAIGTFLDQSQDQSGFKSKPYKILLAFSLKSNWMRLTTTEKGNDLSAIHGIRALNALGLLLSHKNMAMMFNPYINRTSLSEVLGMAWAVIGRTAIIYTDSFLLISGFLTAKSMLQDAQKTNTMDVRNKIIGRLFRILPNFITLILFCTYILPHLGSGPLWPTVINHHANLCKKHMWRNFMFIHNYFGFENMCLTHTHQIGIDMQLFLITPPVLYVLWKRPKIGIGVLGIMCLLATILKYIKTMEKRLSFVVYFGIDISKMFDTSNYSYIIPSHRIPIYFLGIILYYAISRIKGTVILTPLKAALGWIFFLSMGLLAMIGPYNTSRIGFQYNPFDAALYGALYPLLWGSFISWIVLSCKIGYAGWFGNFLSWKGFRLFTKISYSVYLTQFPVFFYNVGKRRYTDHFTSTSMFAYSEFGAILIVSAILTLLVELPFIEIKKIIFDKDLCTTPKKKLESIVERRHAKFG